MASIQEIKKRKESISNTSKITKAMEMVSISKTKRYSKNVSIIKLFKEGIYEILYEILRHNSIKNERLIDTKGTKGKKTLWIVITSDSGLCGGYNLNVIKSIGDEIKSGDEFIIKGSKGVGLFKTKLGIDKTIRNYTKESEADLVNLGLRITKRILHSFWEKKSVDRVNLVWTKYINQITFQATTTQLLPLNKKLFEPHSDNRSILTPIEYEPNLETILKNILPEYISSSIMHALSESLLSEYASRRIAMENATNNSKDLLEALELEYNKSRQQKITQEITEIVAGSEKESEKRK